MKKTIIFISVISFFTFCKKKNETPAVTAPINNAPVNTPLQAGFGTNVNNLHGVLQAEKIAVPSFSSTTFESRASFNFNSQPYSYYYLMGGIFATTGVNAGTLKLNSTILKYDISTPNQTNRYKDTLSTRNYSIGATWDLTANGNFNSFNAPVNVGFPIIVNNSYLPNTISKSAGLTINFGNNNYSNTDSIIVFIVGGAGTTSYPIKHVSGTATSITFTSTELNGIGTGSGEIIVYGLNYSNMTVNSKNYLYIMQYDVINFVTINP